MQPLAQPEKRTAVSGVDFRCIRKSAFTFLNREIPVRVLDIGTSGLRAVTKAPVKKGQMLGGQLILLGFGERIPVEGRVISVRDYASPNSPLLKGVVFEMAFEEMKPGDRFKLSAVLKLASWKGRSTRI